MNPVLLVVLAYYYYDVFRVSLGMLHLFVENSGETTIHMDEHAFDFFAQLMKNVRSHTGMDYYLLLRLAPRVLDRCCGFTHNYCRRRWYIPNVMCRFCVNSSQ
jgi:hypothetical protein